MTINLVMLQHVVALIAGILILMIPRLLNVIVGIYLILVGVIGLWPSFFPAFHAIATWEKRRGERKPETKSKA